MQKTRIKPPPPQKQPMSSQTSLPPLQIPMVPLQVVATLLPDPAVDSPQTASTRRETKEGSEKPVLWTGSNRVICLMRGQYWSLLSSNTLVLYT